jgi:hypothetical protein
MGGVAEAIGGVEDHVHLLVSMKTTDAPADLVRDLKKASSLWDEDGETREFMCGGCEKCVIVDRLLACCLDIAPRGFLEQLLRA